MTLSPIFHIFTLIVPWSPFPRVIGSFLAVYGVIESFSMVSCGQRVKKHNSEQGFFIIIISTKFSTLFQLSDQLRNGIALRNGKEPMHLPVNCPCGKKFSISHALHCAKSGYTHMRHDAIRDTFAKIMDDVF